MIINTVNLQSLFRGFKASFQKAFEITEVHYKDIAMIAQ